MAKKEDNEVVEVKREPEAREITEELEESYLDYAMSVIVARALPDIRDGLKPVQRRILWAMWDDGLTHNARFRKSANVVGAVLGRYHPHGDSAVYDALARMAQDFSLRNPLIQGQGNWGSVDGDPPAAMRYTEARLTAIGEEMLRDIEKETIDWTYNYDNTRKEPVYLPSAFPNLLVNGTLGIAVGMATSIPPHNLGETIDTLQYLAEHGDASVKELMKKLPGPDFPTGCTIHDEGDVERAYATGRGSVTVRALVDVEEVKGAPRIVITEIPYQVVKANLITKIAELVQDKKLEGIKDIRDESDREGMRIVIDLKSATIPQRIVNYLFRHTELQKKFYFNMVALKDGIQPSVVSLKDILAAFLAHRENVVRRRTEFDLGKAKERAHILEGLVKALDDIDAVIATIKKSEDRADAHANLVKKFKLTPVQADAILEMRLQTLASLERKKIEDELKEKKKLIKELEAILKSKERIREVLVEELKEIKGKYADARRTRIERGGVGEFNDEDFVEKRDVVILLTKDGYIKRMPPESFKTQGRGGRGLRASALKDKDAVAQLFVANTHDDLLFFSQGGKVYRTRAYEVPASSRTSKGKLVQSFLEIPENESITALIAFPHDTDVSKTYLTMVTSRGIVKRTGLEQFRNVRRGGIAAISLKSGDLLRWVETSDGGGEVVCVTRKGQAIRFKESDVREMGRTAAGVVALKLKGDDTVAGVGIIKSGGASKLKLLIVTENGYGKQTELRYYKVQRRGGGGVKTAKVTAKTGPIASAELIRPETEGVIAFSAKGNVIQLDPKKIKTAGRDTQGVRLMRLDSGDHVVDVASF